VSKIYSIKCPSCSAPLNLLGGGNVQTITCSYCKSVIDLEHENKILYQFKNAPRPKVPFDIGMSGEIKGVNYTIIGMIYYRSGHDFAWSDFLLYHEIYGYAWMSVEEGHIIYSRRTRNFPAMLWSELNSASRIEVNKETYVSEERYSASVEYVEGELTWIAKKNDRSYFIDLVGTSNGISAERNETEIEYYISEYLDSKEVFEAFKVPKSRQIFSQEFHPLKPFNRPILKIFSQLSLWILAIVFLIIVAIKIEQDKNPIASFNVSNTQSLGKVETFEVTSTKYLLAIELKSTISYDLDNFTIHLSHENTPIFELNHKTYTIFNANSVSSSWDSDAFSAIAYVKVKKIGKYTLRITPNNKDFNSYISVKVYQSEARINYFVYLGILAFFIFIFYYYFYFHYKSSHLLKIKETTLVKSIEESPILYILLIILFIAFSIWDEME